jgi:hypothetical protein
MPECSVSCNVSDTPKGARGGGGVGGWGNRKKKEKGVDCLWLVDNIKCPCNSCIKGDPLFVHSNIILNFYLDFIIIIIF